LQTVNTEEVIRRDRFKAGVANNIEVIQGQDSLSRANDNQIGAVPVNQARATWRVRSGKWKRFTRK